MSDEKKQRYMLDPVWPTPMYGSPYLDMGRKGRERMGYDEVVDRLNALTKERDTLRDALATQREGPDECEIPEECQRGSHAYNGDGACESCGAGLPDEDKPAPCPDHGPDDACSACTDINSIEHDEPAREGGEG